jgi:DNA-binding transcriptional LysR family regulator
LNLKAAIKDALNKRQLSAFNAVIETGEVSIRKQTLIQRRRHLTYAHEAVSGYWAIFARLDGQPQRWHLPLMNPKLMRTFLAVLRHGSFTRAAEDVHLAQSTVSDQIQALESELGTALFIRSKTGLEVAPAALVLRPYAEDMLALCDEALSAVADTMDRESQSLTVGCLETIASCRLASWLSEFKVGHLKIKMKLRIAGSGELRRLLEQGQLDAAICFHDDKPGPGFVVRTLAREPLTLLQNPARKRVDPFADIGALAAQEFVVTETGCTYRRMFDEFFRQSGAVPPRPIAEVNSVASIISFVGAGSCLGITPRLAAEAAMQRGDVVEIPWPGTTSPSVPLAMIWRRRRIQPQALRQFLEATTGFFAGLRPGDGRLPREEQCL